MTEERRRELEDAVARVVRAHLPGTDLPAIRVWPDRDHDDDPILRVDIFFRPEDEEIRSGMGLEVGLIRAMRERLFALGVTLFPHPEFLTTDDVRH